MEKIELTKEELKYLRSVMQYQSAFSQNEVAYTIEKKLDRLNEQPEETEHVKLHKEVFCGVKDTPEPSDCYKYINNVK